MEQSIKFSNTPIMTTPVDLCIVIPCYNEEEILKWSYQSLKDKLQQLITEKLISEKSQICFVNDGSKDNTWSIIETICQEDTFVSGIKLSRNFGHQSALIAGLTAKVNNFDCYITIDADLQDDTNAIDEMVVRFIEGNEIVYGVRNDRTNDSIFKRGTAYFFYQLMIALKVKTVHNHADFRLIGNRVLIELLNFKEINMFLRGIIPLIGFKSAIVYYKRKNRLAGTTKYPLGKMLAFAWDGITSFSTTPLRIGVYIGVLTFISTIIISLWAFITYLEGRALPGWLSTVIPIALLGGIQMISIGVLGEYIGKIYTEIKRRPRFIIEKEVDPYLIGKQNMVRNERKPNPKIITADTSKY